MTTKRGRASGSRAPLRLEPPLELAEQLERAAAHEGVSTNELAAQALRYYLLHHPPPGATASNDASDLTWENGVRQGRSLRHRGMSYAKIAEILNREGFKTRRGGAWTSTGIGRVLRDVIVRFPGSKGAGEPS